MDAWEIFENKDKDFNDLCDTLVKEGIVSFPYSEDQVTAYIVTIAGPLKPRGMMPWGGSLFGTYLVAVRLKGANYFDLPLGALHPDYVGEKLGLGSCDAEAITHMMHEIGKRLS